MAQKKLNPLPREGASRNAPEWSKEILFLLPNWSSSCHANQLSSLRFKKRFIGALGEILLLSSERASRSNSFSLAFFFRVYSREDVTSGVREVQRERGGERI